MVSRSRRTKHVQAGSGPWTAHCRTSFAAPGRDAITARYTGDANFAGSTTKSVRTVVVLGRDGSALSAQLSRAVHGTTFAGLWTPRGVELSFRARRAGELVIRWYLDAGAGHSRLLGTTGRMFKHPGMASFRLVFDGNARHVLSHLDHARVTSEATFTARKDNPVGTAMSFTIKR